MCSLDGAAFAHLVLHPFPMNKDNPEHLPHPTIGRLYCQTCDLYPAIILPDYICPRCTTPLLSITVAAPHESPESIHYFLGSGGN